MNNLRNSNKKESTFFWYDSVIIWGILFLIQLFVFSIITAYLLIATGWQFNEFSQFIGSYGSNIGVWIALLITEFGTFLISILYLRLRKTAHSEFEKLAGIENINSKNILLGLFYVPVTFFTGIIVSIIQSLFIQDPSQSYNYNLVFSPKNGWDLLIWIVIMLAVVGPVEEIVFRGIIQKGIQNSFKKYEKPDWYSIFLSSLLFTIYHVDFLHFIPIFFMGLLLGLVFYITDSSLICALTHGVYDVISITLMFIF